MGNSWTQEERKESDEFPDRDIHPDHNSSNSSSCSCSFCCSRSSVINCDTNEALMQVNSNLSKKQIAPHMWKADINPLLKASYISLRKAESELTQHNYFDNQVLKESLASNVDNLSDCGLQKDIILRNTHSVVNEEHKYDCTGQEVCKSVQLKETTGAFGLPPSESRSLYLNEDFSTARIFKDKVVCPLQTREDNLVLEDIRNVQPSFENCDNVFPIFNKVTSEVLLGTNLGGSIPFVCENLHNLNAHIFAKDMMEWMNMIHSMDGANLSRDSDFIDEPLQSHVSDESLKTDTLSSDENEKNMLLLTDDYSSDLIEGVFIGLINKVDKPPITASFQWKGKSYSAIIYKNKIEYRGRKVGKKLNIDDLLATGQHVTLHIKSESRTKQGELIAFRVILDVENREQLEKQNYFMSPLFLTAINKPLGLSSIQATIESVFDTWGTLSLMGGEGHEKAIFVSENVYINDFNVPKESTLNLVLYKGMPALCNVNSYNCDITIKLFLFVGEIVELTSNVGIISFFHRGDKEKAVIFIENLYVNKEKFRSSDLCDVLQQRDVVAFLCVPSETTEIRFKALYLLLCNDKQNVSVTFDTFNDSYHYFLELLSSCQTKHEQRECRTIEMSSVSNNITNKSPDFNAFVQSEANFRQASQSFLQRLKHFKQCTMPEELQENNYYSLLNALGTALVFGGLLWKEYITNKFQKNASSTFNLNNIRFFDITGTVYEEGLLISGEMKILFHVNDVYVNGEKCTQLQVGTNLHCSATELPYPGCRGETHFAWCLWQGTRPDVQHVFNVFELKKCDSVTLKENKPYKGQVVAVYPPHAALVRLYIGGSMVPIVVFSHILQDKMCPFSFDGEHWIIDYINIGDCLNVSVQPTKKSNKVAKLGYQWTAVSARNSCPCEMKPQNTRILSGCKRNLYRGSVCFLCKSFVVVAFDTDEGIRYGFFIKDLGTINNEPVSSNVTLSNILTHVSSITFQKDSIYFVNEHMHYISVIYVNGLVRKMKVKCNSCTICGKLMDKLVDFPVKHLNGAAGVLIDLRDDDGLLECGMYKAIFHKSRLFLSGKKMGSSQVLSDMICEGMKFRFVAIVSEGDWYGAHTSHICTCVWDSQRPSVNTVMESYITDAADGDMLKENVFYFGIVTDIAPPSVAVVTIKTFGNSIPVLLYISSLAVGKERTMCAKDDWVNDYLTIGEKLKVKVASKTKNYKFRTVSSAWKTSDTFTMKNVESNSAMEDILPENQNSSCYFETQILDQTYSKYQRCDLIVNKADISFPAEVSSDSCISSVDPISNGIIAASQNTKIVDEESYLFRKKPNMELDDMNNDNAEEVAVTLPVNNAFAKDAQTLVSDLESLGSMLVVGSLIWKEFLAKNSETTNDMSHCRFTDAEVTEIQPVSETTAVLTIAMPNEPNETVYAFFNEIDAYNIDANSDDKIYCTAIALPEIGRFKETHAIWLLWQGMPPAVHEVFSVFKTEYPHAIVLQENVRYLGVIVAVLPPYVGLMKIVVSSSVSVPVLIHVNALATCKEMLLKNSSVGWIIDYVSVGDALTVSIESTKNASLKEIGIKWRVKNVWNKNIENVSLPPVDDICMFRGMISAVYSKFGVITFETGGYLKRALFFKDQTNMNWQELKAVVASKENYEVSFHVKPECSNPKSNLWLASNVMRVEECENCAAEDSCVANKVDSFIKDKYFIGFVEKLEPEMGFAVFKLCGRYERAVFFYTKIYYDGSQMEPKSALTMLRIDMRLSIKIQRITKSEQDTVKFTAEYVEIRPYNDLQGSGDKVESVTSVTNLLLSKLNVSLGLEEDHCRILRGLKGKIKYNELGTGIIEFKYKNEDYEVPVDQSTNILINAQGSRNLSDLLPTGKTVHFNLLCNNSMTNLSVECIWETKKPKKIVYKNAPELLPMERNRIKPGGMYQAKVVQLKKFSFIAEIQMEDVVASVFVTNVSYHPFSDTRQLSYNECVSLHVNKGDTVFVVVERSRNDDEIEWFATEAWKEAPDNTPLPSSTLKVLRNIQTGEQGKIVTLSPTEGQLQTAAGIVLNFVQEDVYLYGLPLKNVDLRDILSIGITVSYSVTSGSIKIGPRVFVSKVWIGCHEILSFAETYGAIAQYRASRRWKPQVFEELMKELGKYRQVESENVMEQSLQKMEDISDAVWPADDSFKSTVGSKSEQCKDLHSMRSMVSKTENKKLSPKDYTNLTVSTQGSKTYASTLKKQEHVLPCGSKDSEKPHNKNASVLDSEVRGIMEMSLNEIMCTYHGNSSSEFSSHVMHTVDNMVQKQLLKTILPAAISSAIKHFAGGTSETSNFQEETETRALVRKLSDIWKSRLQLLLENHFHFSDDEMFGEKDVELPPNGESNNADVCERTDNSLQNIPVVTDCGTQTTSTGKVIYLNIYADANDEVNHS